MGDAEKEAIVRDRLSDVLLGEFRGARCAACKNVLRGLCFVVWDALD